MEMARQIRPISTGNNMAAPRTCSRCSARIDATARSGTCPGCRVKGVMSGMLDRADDGEVTVEPNATGDGSPSEIRWNKEFQDYRIEDVIGRGGMGVIYRARHQQVNRVVALKRVSFLESEASDARARFRAEIEAAATLEHPYDITLTGAGTTLPKLIHLFPTTSESFNQFGEFQFKITGRTGFDYSIEAADNADSDTWIAIALIRSDGTVRVIEDLDSTGLPQQFYRVIEVAP